MGVYGALTEASTSGRSPRTGGFCILPSRLEEPHPEEGLRERNLSKLTLAAEQAGGLAWGLVAGPQRRLVDG